MTYKSYISVLTATTFLTSAALADELTRIATVPLGGEITGMFLEDGDLFFNVQHPSDDLPTEFAKATVGVVANADFDAGGMDAPMAEADKHVVKTTLGEYQILFQEGSLGMLGSISGVGGEIKVSNDPDFNAFVRTSTSGGYLFTNWEDRPGGMSRVAISRADDGAWSVDESDAKMVDFSPVGGTWVNCFGTLSPWNTPLTSEELYFDNTVDWNNPEHKRISDPLALEAYLGEYPNPYNYGFIVEITDPKKTATPVKHFGMGRYSHENTVVMPDRRTAYLSDDGTDVVFYKFVSDVPGDMSSGTLYAAKIKQLGDPGSDPASTPLQISWIELAHGTNEEIATWIKDYDGITQADYVAGQNNYITDAEIAAWAAGDVEDNRVAFLESRKAAVAKGATAEFRKMEGVNINLRGAEDGSIPYVYMTMSAIEKGMSDDQGDIQLAENKCGVVYEMRLDDNYNVSKMVPVVAGGAYDTNNEANKCDINAISNPDNVVILDNGSVVIGEDTGNHENNAMWLWKPDRTAM